MQIERVADPGAEWDAFVEATPGASLGHAAGWRRVLQDAYGLDSEYLAARDADGAIAGVLPLVRFRSLRGRLQLISLPYLDTAGILARSPAAESALLEAAVARVRDTGADRLELRLREPLTGAPATGAFNRIDLFMGLEASEEKQWSALPAKVRNHTRKATREGLSLIEGGTEELQQAFYEPFQHNMRDLGSPVHGRRFFAAAAEVFGPRLRFVCTRLGAQNIGGLVAIDFAGAVSVPWASTLRSQRHRCPNHIIYWETLRWAIARGARELDFGRSPLGSGTHVFKLGWGAIERPLVWRAYTSDGQPMAVAGPDPGAWLQRLSRVWARLPVSLASQLGPRIRRRLSN